MKILVTGTEGYLGALLAPLLANRGHEVTGVDIGYYRNGFLYNANTDLPKTLIKDIRHLTLDDLAGHDAVVHMAELSNDPAGELAPHITYEVNHQGSVRLARMAKEAGARRFIYMSSCSVYGVADGDEPVTEETPSNPQTAYAICKTLSERDILPLADSTFSPTFFRNATAFGASPRQRFDIVVNNLCGLAWTTGEIAMTSDGTPWRPLVHGLDIGKAICCALEAPIDAIHGQILNIGSNAQNYRVREVAEIVAKAFLGCKTTFGAQGADNRSYRVSFDKLGKHLPAFSCDWDVPKGARQFYELFKTIDLTRDDFEFRGYTRLKQLQYLIRTGQIDENFFWKTNF
ncbi:MAG: NAD-dependent epimerase/dehydratase family protein [Porticoccaceae bacterium]